MSTYIQVINNFVNLIGGAKEGLPLPKEFLDQNHNIKNLEANNYIELPQINDYYDDIKDEFIPYQEWLKTHPPSEPEIPDQDVIQAEMLLNQVKILAALNRQDEFNALMLLQTVGGARDV
ncbi:hypothetical protein [Desulforamulus ruminis]|uniref:Uncharacterized protein n=1 Tax=Desulforamulus ruminis (strain ATCC 23193 / DSM 2154 / NCIMB 8452 / DL) TaxID=696281 RepID=F6DPM4_DESRL|nr:hypothetical protein [Desulforamulus ruminis]AEG59601.1 hypothetical protein Desru_1328 [Desulforamulus ruminis DSM 2154]